MQALVIAHAAFGHNHFFRNNHLFRQWTEASAILDYLEFARSYIARLRGPPRRGGGRARAGCGARAVAPRRAPARRRAAAEPEDGAEARARAARVRRAGLRRSLAHRARPASRRRTPTRSASAAAGSACRKRTCCISWRRPRRKLQSWEREVIRIVRLIAQYFYPQPQAKLMNEGCATWVHQRIMTRLHETGQIDDAAFLEVLHSTSNVIMQPGFDHPAGGRGFNPYALGYAMMTDIERICTEPTDGGPRLVPRHRRQRRPARHAALRLGELPRRELRAAVPVAGGDARSSACSGCSTTPTETDAAGRRDPRRCRLPRHPPQPGAQLRSRPTATPTCRWSTSTWRATAG